MRKLSAISAIVGLLLSVSETLAWDTKSTKEWADIDMTMSEAKGMGYQLKSVLDFRNPDQKSFHTTEYYLQNDHELLKCTDALVGDHFSFGCSRLVKPN